MANKLMRVSKWSQQWFAEGSRPSVNTVKSWIDKGILEGEVIGGNYYVYADQDCPVGKRPEPKAKDLVKQFKQRKLGSKAA